MKFFATLVCLLWAFSSQAAMTDSKDSAGQEMTAKTPHPQKTLHPDCPVCPVCPTPTPTPAPPTPPPTPAP